MERNDILKSLYEFGFPDNVLLNIEYVEAFLFYKYKLDVNVIPIIYDDGYVEYSGWLTQRNEFDEAVVIASSENHHDNRNDAKLDAIELAINYLKKHD